MSKLFTNFLRYRPFLYHLTSDTNRGLIAASRVLLPAAALIQQAGSAPDMSLRRTSHVSLRTPFGDVQIRDQSPLHFGHVLLHPGWTEQDVVDDINRRVFFWPGTDESPVESGMNHYRRYAAESPVVLRVPTSDLLAANPHIQAELSSVNSGAPRTSGGKKSPRGPNTFLDWTRFHGTASSVIEVTFAGTVYLPPSTEFGRTPRGVWQAL